jgi:hypothetical protein
MMQPTKLLFFDHIPKLLERKKTLCLWMIVAQWDSSNEITVPIFKKTNSKCGKMIKK